MPKRFQNKTFTLIEMLVVVVIIGILAGVLVPRLVGARERASDSARIVKVGQISSAVELYAQEYGSTYPLAPLTTTGTSIATPSVADKISPYLTTIPTDPGKGTVAISGFAGNIQVTGDSFAYWTNDAGTGYAITALMESNKGNTTNSVGVIDSDKQGSYQVVGKGITYAYGFGGEAPVGITQNGTDLIISNGTNTYVIMDRNLGASEAGTGPASYGWYFQWGNNFGFWNGVPGYLNQDGNATITTGTTFITSPSIPYSNNIFVLGTPAHDDWAEPSNSSLRPQGEQGPCPSGYHIPTKAEREGLYTTRKDIYTTGVDNGILLQNTLLLPIAGERRYSTSTARGQSIESYSHALYWSSTPTSDGLYSYTFYFDLGRIVTAFNYERTFGYSIRCFKN